MKHVLILVTSFSDGLIVKPEVALFKVMNQIKKKHIQNFINFAIKTYLILIFFEQ